MLDQPKVIQTVVRLSLTILTSLLWGFPAPPVSRPAGVSRHNSGQEARSNGRPCACGAGTSSAPTRPPAGRLDGIDLLVAGPSRAGAIRPTRFSENEAIHHFRFSTQPGRPKIACSFNPDDDLAAIRRAGFTHILVTYLQGMPDPEQRRELDEYQRHGLKLIYRLVDLVDHDRRAGNDALVRHTVLLLRDHPALAAWQTFEETNLPPEVQIAVYRKVKGLDPRHPVINILTNEYSPGWYRRTYSDDAQDIVMIDYYPYKRGYDGWPYIGISVPALRAIQKRPLPIIPMIQASSSARVVTAEDTAWPPAGGLEKQVNLWWSLGADAGVAFWVWRGNKDYPFVGVADPDAPPYALPETTALLARIPDGDLPWAGPMFTTERGSSQARSAGRSPGRHGESQRDDEIDAVRVWQPRVNYLKNSGFEQGLEGWVGYNERAVPTGEAYAGHGAARMENAGAPKAIGLGQRTDLLVPPNATVTFSAYYKVLRETTFLQWSIGTTAYPKFGAAELLERKESLPPGDWRRGSISVTNATGIPQRITGVSIISNRFTGDVLLDNFQLEMAPLPSPYSAGSQPRPARLRFTFSGAGPRVVPGTRGSEWTLAAWSAPEVPPTEGSYACLAALEPVHPPHRGQSLSPALELRLRVDPGRSDQYGWAGALEVAAGAHHYLRTPLALAPGQHLFWALSADREGDLILRAAPAGYGLATASAKGAAPGMRIRAAWLGSDAAGGHPLNGLAGSGRFLPRTLSLPEVEQMRAGIPS
jgi:carbohydrate binding protein with CBM4/9 domain